MTLRPTRLYHWLCAALAAAALVALTTGSALAQHGRWGAPGRPEARADDGLRIAIVPAPARIAEQQAADQVAAPRLPREPRAGAALALVPLPRTWFAGAMAMPVLLLGVYWLWLGSQRARAADPLRERREAAVALGRAVDAVRTATSGATRVEALLTWQRAAACALGLPMRAPTAAVVQSARLHVSATAAGEWAELWAQSEHAVHGPNGELPYDWYERAAWVAGQTGIPRFNVLRGLLPQRLFAAGGAAALFTCVVWAGPAAAGPLADYRAGNFAAARDAWQQRGAAAPTDWIARYNLGLAETQLGDAGRGLADTTAAFVQHPGDADVRWNLGAFVEALPGADPRLAALARGAGVAGVVRVLSPAASQGAMVAGVVALAGGLALARRRRQRDQHGRPWHALAVVMPGVGLILIGALALRAYGPLADPAVAVVAARTELRSVPTAAAQAQRPIDAGALVTVGKQFLDWVQVRRPDGEVGWLREADLVPIYAARAGEVDGTAKASPGAGAEGREARDG